ATYGTGLFHISDGEEHVYNTANGFPSDNILSIFQGKGGVYVGTLDAGLIHLRNGTWSTVVEAENNDDPIMVWSMDRDDSGRLWLGTWYKGLCRLSDGIMTCFDTEDGLRSMNINAVRWDPTGQCLWVGTGSGLQ